MDSNKAAHPQAPDDLENLLEPLDLILGLTFVFIESSPQVFPLGNIASGAKFFGQRCPHDEAG